MIEHRHHDKYRNEKLIQTLLKKREEHHINYSHEKYRDDC